MTDRTPFEPLQKFAWFNLIVFAVTLALYLIAVPINCWLTHRSWLQAGASVSGVFGVLGVWGLSPFLLHSARRKRGELLDEWEDFIWQRAVRISMGIIWGLFVLVSMSIWCVADLCLHLTTLQFPVEFLPNCVLAGMAVLTVTHSVTILIQYKQDSRDGI